MCKYLDTNSKVTKKFLAAIDRPTQANILKNIADNYGICENEAFNEVTDVDAENLLDYMVEPHRTAASVLMKRHGFR